MTEKMVDAIDLIRRECYLSTLCKQWPADVHVSSSSSALLRWVQFHLDHTIYEPRFQARIPSVSIIATSYPALLNSLAAMVKSQESTLVEGFLGQYWQCSRIEDYLVWVEVDSEGRADRRKIIIQASDRSWIVCAEDDVSTALLTVRVAREVLRTSLARLGAITIHAALVGGTSAGSVLIIGGSGSGKTTLSLGLAQLGGYAIGTDQTELLRDHHEPDRVVGTALPNANRLGPGTVSRLSLHPDGLLGPIIRDGSSIFDGNPAPDKRWVTPREAEVYFAVCSAPVSGVDTIVLLQRDPQASTPQSYPVSLKDLSQHLTAEFRASDPLFASFWLTPSYDRPVNRCTLEDAVDLLSHLPRTLLVWDPTRHSIEEAARCIDAALVSQTPNAE